jgi:biopolymer transport protein ExbD
MASLMDTAVVTGKRRGVCRTKKHNLKIDMTPLVDLGFLLIAFFIITTELSKPVVANLAMPKDGPDMPLSTSNALTVLLISDNRVYYYEGSGEEAIANNRISETTYSVKDGIGKIIRAKQQWLDNAGISPEKRNGLMLLIKATPNASYENVVAMLDEALINNVKKYTLLKSQPEEIGWIEAHQ